MEIKNAIITSASINVERGFILDASICLDYGGGGQCFGGCVLYLSKTAKHHELMSPAGHFIWRVMEVAEVTRWSGLVGKTVRVKATHSKVQAIGHIVKDDWFDPEDELF